MRSERAGQCHRAPRSTTLSFISPLWLVNAVGLTGILVTKCEWFGTRTHLVWGKYTHT